MKKLLSCLLSGLIICSCLSACDWFGAGKDEKVAMNLMVNGNKVDVASGEIYEKNNDYMVPMEPTASALGYAVQWNKADEKVTLEKNNDVKIVSIDRGSFTGMTAMTDDAKDDPNVNESRFQSEEDKADEQTEENAMELRNKPEVNNDKLYVPVNFFEEVVGAKIAIDQNTQTINITQQDTKEQIS